MHRIVFILICFISMTQGFCNDENSGLWPDFQTHCTCPHSSVIHFKPAEGKQITYIAVRHSNDLTSPVIKTIENIITAEEPEICILEGFEEPEGFNPQRIIDLAVKKCMTGKCGENLYAAKLCTEKSIDFIGGDIGEDTYLEPLAALGFSQKDLVFFLLLQQIPFWHREDVFQEEEPESLFESFMQETISSWLKIPVNYTYEEFLAWYKQNLGKDYDLAQDFQWSNDNKEMLPYLGENATIYQKICAHVLIMRDRHIVEMIQKMSASHSKVLVIYGGAHYESQSKVLQKKFGQPVNRFFID